MPVTLQHVRDALAAGDPLLVSLVEQLLAQPEADRPPPREGLFTFQQFLHESQSKLFRRKTLEEQAQWRMERLAALESPSAEEPLSEKLRVHEVLLELWNQGDAFSRDCLLQLVARLPLEYGPFKAFKQIFKQAEAKHDTEMLGALAARFDMALAGGSHSVSRRTLGYLCRRGWRYLRRIGQSLPVCYVDAAVDCLVHYVDQGDFYESWIFNQIFFHETKAFAGAKPLFERRPRSKRAQKRPDSYLKHRAFADLWKRSPRPLFTLLERAQCELVRDFAASALKSDFRAALRDVEPAWAARLVSVGSASVDQFVVWILDNVPKFEQGKFRELGLHEAVLRLFDSRSPAAQKYAASYARTHARDLPTEQLILLANQAHEDVRKLAIDLLLSRDPRKEVGLEAWGRLLETPLGHATAASVLRKQFGAAELTPEWFAERLLSPHAQGRSFARERLPQLHPSKQLGVEYFTSLADRLDPANHAHQDAAVFIGQQLEKFDLNAIPPERLRKLLLHRWTQPAVIGWVEQGKLKPQLLEADFLKRIVFHPAWESDPWIAKLRQDAWAKHLQFDERLAETIFGWLRDVRLFTPDQLGFDWLMLLVARSEPLYHKFALDVATRVLLPADFAPKTPAEPKAKAEGAAKIDLKGASFVFTGTLATMNRSEAQGKVSAAGGANSDTVSKKLDYLVIGDEGSPLYGQGRKGSKQTKAEKLNDDGAGIRIISETAFLQMLAGEQREFSADAVQAGCGRLWSMLVEAEHPDAPLARFALTYLRRHHPDICLAETDRPVDPGAEIPATFLTFERVKPLLESAHKPLRDLALEFCKWEFARWQPPIAGLVETCESPFPEVRAFVAQALTADAAPEHRTYRINPDVLTADAVYSFCESRNDATRALGMKLIDAHPRLRVPGELFRLTESPDGRVRAFVIRTFWSLYRDRGVKADWKPKPPSEQLTKKKKPADAKATPADKVGPGVPPRPEQPPAGVDQLQSLLRRILFEVPPGRPPGEAGEEGKGVVKLRPLPAREAKLRLIETLRDLGLADAEFAAYILPLLREFMHSRGKSEQDACLVAATRIQHKHPQLTGGAA